MVLTLLLRAMTGTNLSNYLTQRLWRPTGAEADATWITTRDGTETDHCGKEVGPKRVY